MPRETHVERVTADREQVYRVTPAPVNIDLTRRFEMLSENVNRIVQDIGIRLQRIEERLVALGKKE